MISSVLEYLDPESATQADRADLVSRFLDALVVREGAHAAVGPYLVAARRMAGSHEGETLDVWAGQWLRAVRLEAYPADTFEGSEGGLREALARDGSTIDPAEYEAVEVGPYTYWICPLGW